MTAPRLLRRPAFLLAFAWLLAGVVPAPSCLATAPAAVAAALRERIPFDDEWRFAFGHPYDPKQDFNHATGYFSYLAKAGYADGPADAKFDASAWRQLDLPHDWAVEAPFDGRGSHSHGYKAIGRNFPERSVGWYRKSFRIPAGDQGRRISLEFDGVYRDSVVWVNGFYIGRQPSGYTGFRYDVTDYLNYGGDNVVAVRVDATLEEGWFYEGAGIYRHTWLTKTSPLHVAPLGTVVNTQVSGNSAEVTVRTTLVNEGTTEASCEIEQTILDPSGMAVATTVVRGLVLAAGASLDCPATLNLSHPELWSIEHPALHRVQTKVRSAGATVDRTATSFGVRTLRFDPDAGFFLNGRHVLLKGTNNHQDHAGVGVAMPDALWDYRIRRLQEMGSNAYRCSHNPPAPELLDACDRLGMLVIDESRLMGPSPEQLSQLEQLIRRDRTHPSVILWSVGNEEWALEGNEKGARLTTAMQDFAHRLDPTRRTTVAISGGWGAGSSTTTDVMGYNYYTHGSTDEQHAKFPHQSSLGTEETTTQATRGVYFDDRAHSHLGPQAKGDSGNNAEDGWQHFAARPYLAGLFYWTGFDYRGESTPFTYPAVGTQFGLMDTCGFPKDSYYFLQSWWTDRPMLHLYPHWNWAGREGQEILVRCNSNHEAVELIVNGASLGRKEMPRNGHLEWKAVYQPGAIEARGYRQGKVVETVRIETTGEPAHLILTADRPAYRADGRDVAVISVSTIDRQGRLVPTANSAVKFSLSGGQIIGVGNGDPASHESDKAPERRLFNGFAQVLVQTEPHPGPVVLTATAPGLAPATLTLTTTAPALPREAR